MSYQPQAPDHEPHKILIKRDILKDPARNDRAVPIKVYYPVAHSLTDLPVVLWSHGLGGSREGAAFLGRYIASHGYVVINIQHPGTDSSLWEGKPGHPWDVIRAATISAEDEINRFKDVPFVLDRLPDWLADHPEVGEHADLSRIGMSGHSFGALTTQVIAGQSFPDQDDIWQDLSDERITAGVLYSPVPIWGRDEAKTAKAYQSIKKPLLHMSGTKDSSPVRPFDYHERMKVFAQAGATPQYVLVLEEGDHMVFAGSRGKLADNPRRHTQEALIKIVSLAFWDGFLKENRDARDWLEEGLVDFVGSDAAVEYRL